MSGSLNHTNHLWDGFTGKLLDGFADADHTCDVDPVDISPDGRKIISSSPGEAILRDAGKGKPIDGKAAIGVSTAPLLPVSAPTATFWLPPPMIM